MITLFWLIDLTKPVKLLLYIRQIRLLTYHQMKDSVAEARFSNLFRRIPTVLAVGSASAAPEYAHFRVHRRTLSSPTSSWHMHRRVYLPDASLHNRIKFNGRSQIHSCLSYKIPISTSYVAWLLMEWLTLAGELMQAFVSVGSGPTGTLDIGISCAIDDILPHLSFSTVPTSHF